MDQLEHQLLRLADLWELIASECHHIQMELRQQIHQAQLSQLDERWMDQLVAENDGPNN